MPSSVALAAMVLAVDQGRMFDPQGALDRVENLSRFDAGHRVIMCMLLIAAR
jgi:hypothetical protein